MTIVYINNMFETFTPTQSGALATHLWEVYRVAEQRGDTSWIITRDSEDAAFPVRNLIKIPWPRYQKKGHWTHWGARANRKLLGWPEMGQPTFVRRIIRQLNKHNLHRHPLHVANDAELAVYLRWKYPHARIVHHFHNQCTIAPRFLPHYAKAVNATVCVSEFTRRWIINEYGLDPAKVLCIHNAVNTEEFYPATAEPPGPITFGFCGRTGREKGVDILLDAALKLAEHRTDFRIQIVGTTSFKGFSPNAYQDELAERSDRLTERGIQVMRPGHVDRHRVPGFFRQTHVHVVPSRWEEPFGMTASEGMASGLASIVARSGGLPEVVGDTALMFDIGSVDQLADCMARLLDQPELRLRLARVARARALEVFSWDLHYDRLRAALKGEPQPVAAPKICPAAPLPAAIAS